MDATPTVKRFPAHSAEVVMTVLGFTQQGWAQRDTATVNRRIDLLDEAFNRHRQAIEDDAPTAPMLGRAVAQLTLSVSRAMVRCTNSGAVRTECRTCDHTRQLAALAEFDA
ncbi:hypothetical protein [Streptomyces sp. NPDC051572]|uniref:hypothetical protein n=1 Tax=Streptomyces sp. NPDC051572 TaxID=3155802 RepID=UPI00344D7674